MGHTWEKKLLAQPNNQRWWCVAVVVSVSAAAALAVAVAVGAVATIAAVAAEVGGEGGNRGRGGGASFRLSPTRKKRRQARKDPSSTVLLWCFHSSYPASWTATASD